MSTSSSTSSFTSSFLSGNDSGKFEFSLPPGNFCQRLLFVSLPLLEVNNSNNSTNIWQSAAVKAALVSTNQKKLKLKQQQILTGDYFRVESNNFQSLLSPLLPSTTKSATNMPVATFVIDANEELIYRGEGNSSLVVALKSKRQVLRLLKSDAKKLQQKNDENVRSLLLQHIDYNEGILPAALPHFFFHPPKMVCLDHEQLEAIRALVKGKRPSFRLGKTISNCDYALLMPDYCTIPKCISTLVNATGTTLSIEIKPKQGFLPLLSLLSDPTLAVKSRVCRFGLSQFYKLQKKSISALSSYCPLDLFSGCCTRALHALYNLVLSPQNNFRVFADANLVYGDQASYGKSGNLEFLQEVLRKFLLIDSRGCAEEKENKAINLKLMNESAGFETTNTRSNYNTQANGNNVNSVDAIAIFCNLLLNSLYDDKIAQANRNSKNSLLASSKFSILEQLASAKANASLNEPCFLGTFLAMFDGSLAPLPTPSIETTMMTKEVNFNAVNGGGDINNNSNNNHINGSDDNHANQNGNGHVLVVDDELNNNHQVQTEHDDNTTLNGNCGDNINKMNNVKNGEAAEVTVATSQTCLLHQKRPMCVCAESNKNQVNGKNCPERLPAGSVLGSILRAQKLDQLDSLKAVELYESLCERYQILKGIHYNNCTTTTTDDDEDFVNSFADEKYVTFVEAFISANLVDLEKFWSFLISLTAKDCSLMVAIQRADYYSSSSTSSSEVVCSSSLSSTKSGVSTSWCSVHTEPTTGHRYVVSISLTDLDFKQAYKVERSLHNDRRMVKSFWSALASEPTSFPADLHSSVSPLSVAGALPLLL